MRTSLFILTVCFFLFTGHNAASKSIDSEVYGLYTQGDCKSAYLFFYISKNLGLHIQKEGAKLVHPISVRITDNFLIQQWKHQNKKGISYGVQYSHFDKNVLKVFYKGYDNNQNLDELPDNPPDEFKSAEYNKCEDIPSDMSFIHAEGIIFMKSFVEISMKCEKAKEKCVEYMFSIVDISKDNELSKAELSRIMRIITYIAVVSNNKKDWVDNKEITGALGIVSIISPFIAKSIIEGSDYDNDGQLSLDEIFYDRKISDATQALEKLSFDVAVTFFTKMFSAFGSILSFFK